MYLELSKVFDSVTHETERSRFNANQLSYDAVVWTEKWLKDHKPKEVVGWQGYVFTAFFFFF